MSAAAKPKILRTDTEVRIGESDLDRLAALAEVVTPPAWDEETLAAAAVGADLIVHSFFPTISARVIEVLEGRRPRNIKNAEALGLA